MVSSVGVPQASPPPWKLSDEVTGGKNAAVGFGIGVGVIEGVIVGEGVKLGV